MTKRKQTLKRHNITTHENKITNLEFTT